MRQTLQQWICGRCSGRRSCQSPRSRGASQNLRFAFRGSGSDSRIVLSNSCKILSNFSNIFTSFCIQNSIFQHFSKSTRFCKILLRFCKILQCLKIIPKFHQNFRKILKMFVNVCKCLQILQNVANLLARR